MAQTNPTGVCHVTHKKVMCSHCDKQPEGFRGEHELRRHVERAHNSVIKAYKCVDISENQTFLANCKACTSGKVYYADYNAAAHLRRAHFNSKWKGAAGHSNVEKQRGGEQPAVGMDILKDWMQELEVRRENTSVTWVPEENIPVSSFGDVNRTGLHNLSGCSLPVDPTNVECREEQEGGYDDLLFLAGSLSQYHRWHGDRKG